MLGWGEKGNDEIGGGKWVSFVVWWIRENGGDEKFVGNFPPSPTKWREKREKK